MSLRIDFSSTVERAMAPAGRGIAFVLGNAFGGSAGSFTSDERALADFSCAVAELAAIKIREKHAIRIRNLFIFIPRTLELATPNAGFARQFRFLDFGSTLTAAVSPALLAATLH
jgi:hypothetical protein